jgi:hypothetical protein
MEISYQPLSTVAAVIIRNPKNSSIITPGPVEHITPIVTREFEREHEPD